jgi:glutamate racemase
VPSPAPTRTRRAAVIATAGTVESGAYVAAINEADPRVDVRQQACPDLVPMVEAGHLDGPLAEATVRGYLEPLLAGEPQIDTLLLGCTHYPLLRPVIERVVGPRVGVVDSAFTAALAVEDLLDALGGRSDGAVPGTNRIVTTGDIEAFSTVARRVFGAELPVVEGLEPMAAIDLP